MNKQKAIKATIASVANHYVASVLASVIAEAMQKMVVEAEANKAKAVSAKAEAWAEVDYKIHSQVAIKAKAVSEAFNAKAVSAEALAKAWAVYSDTLEMRG
jgi:hypothetical protein